MKLLTILIPTYNMSAYLGRCLSSLTACDAHWHDLLEVLVIDDGSTDDSLSLARRFEQQFPQTVRTIHKENGNYGSCINVGLTEAQGQYIKVIDADDSVDTCHFMRLLEQLQSTPVDVLFTDYLHVEPSGKVRLYVSLPIEPRRILSLYDLSDLAMRAVMMHAVTYRTSMLRDIAYRQTEGISYTDQEWVFLPLAQARSVYYLPLSVYQYLVGRSGQTVDVHVWERNFWMELQGMRVMLEQYRALRSQSLPDDSRRYLCQRLQFRNYAIYEAYFTRFSSTRNNDLMRQYDLYLRDISPELWQAATAYSIFGFAFVTRWRKADYPAFVPGLWPMARLGRLKKWMKWKLSK